MAKIAAELKRALIRRDLNGGPGQLEARMLAEADGWTVEDVVCTAGPDDRSFEERHSYFRVVIVGAGTFQYRSTPGRELMTPGSLLLGNAGHSFQCGHEHGTGDRCLAFGYAPDYFERIGADAGARGRAAFFGSPGLPPLRALAPLLSHACARWMQSDGAANLAWEELSVRLAAGAVQAAAGVAPRSSSPLNAEARVTRAVRAIDHDPAARLTLRHLARHAGLSAYHFLRTFERVTGLTPHQYILRTRLREAAVRLATEPGKVVEIAFDCGFGDVSNFNRAFRAEFGLSPRAYRSRRYTTG